MADIISGKVNPSGKLPFTVEKDFSDSQDPKYNYFGDEPYYFGDNKQYKSYWLDHDPKGASEQFKKYVRPSQYVAINYDEGVFMGYRWYDFMKKDVNFPFGHGLSYTSFAYSNLKLSANQIGKEDSLSVSLSVKNNGKLKGSEIIQLYVSDKECSVKRPIKELKAFKKIVLLPGEEKVVQFKLANKDFAFWSEKIHNWLAEPGEFEVLVGSSSRDIRLNQKVVMK